MPRSGRVVLANHPHHVVQRGHNRDPVFLQTGDFRFYLTSLAEWKRRLGCRVYAFCLMSNHVHIVVDPGSEAQNLGKLMKRVAGRYTRYANRCRGRSGTVWEGRFKSSPIETDRYLMACCRYVELNPVRAGMVGSPGDYTWSSYNDRVGRCAFPWLDEDPCFMELGETRQDRESRYEEWIESTIPAGEWSVIRSAVQRGQLAGDVGFRQLVERRTGRRIEFRGPGRPVRQK